MKTFLQKIQYTSLFISLIFVANAQVNLSLTQCRELALEKNEEIKIAEKTIEKTDAEKSAMASYRLPSIYGSAAGLYMFETIKSDMYLPTVKPNLETGGMDPNIMVDATGQPIVGPDGNYVFNLYAWLPLELKMQGTYLAGVNLEQPIYTGGKISAGNRMAEIGQELAGYNLELQKMNIITEADQYYWMYVSVQDKVKLAEEAVAMLQQIHKKVSNAHEAGMVLNNEVLKVEVQLNKAMLDLQKAENGLELSRMSLCLVTGLSLDTAVVTTDSLEHYSVELLTSDTTENVALRPEFKALEKNVVMEEQNIRMVKSDYLPTLGVAAGYSYFGGLKISNSSMNQGFTTVLASLKIPIFSWGQGKNKVASAVATKEIKQLELEKNRKLLELQIKQAKLNLKDAFTRISISEKAFEQSKENLRISNDNYDLGFETLSDLLMAKVEWQKAYNDLIDAKTDYKIKETIYLKTTGRLVAE